MHGEYSQLLRESLAGFTNRTNGRGRWDIYTSAQFELYQMAANVLDGPHGRPLIMQDPETGVIELIPGLDGPVITETTP